MLSTTAGRLPRRGTALLLAALVGLLCVSASSLCAADDAAASASVSASELDGDQMLLAQADEEGSEGKLEPRYKPREPEPKSSYNKSYIFGMTRGVADSTIHPAVKAPLFLFTIPLDIVLLPFAAIGGAFG